MGSNPTGRANSLSSKQQLPRYTFQSEGAPISDPNGDWMLAREVLPEIERRDARIVDLEREADEHAFDLSPAMVQARNDQLNAQVRRLQRALYFWLPNVPDDDAEIAERAGSDAMLLVGLEHAEDVSAESLGWIRLRGTVARLETAIRSVLELHPPRVEMDGTHPCLCPRCKILRSALERSAVATPLDRCMYCKRPSDADGGIFHESGCAGLEKVILTRLQYDLLVSRRAAVEAAHRRMVGDVRETVEIPMTHWSKDPLVPYAGCACSTCEHAQQPVAVSVTDSTEAHLPAQCGLCLGMPGAVVHIAQCPKAQR